MSQLESHKYEIVQATRQHAEILATIMRKEDADEYMAVSGHKAYPMMIEAIKSSDVSYTGLFEGQPICMFGVVNESLIFKRGLVWFVGSSKLDDHPIGFLRRAKKGLMKMLSEYDILENYVDARYTKCIKWLKWMGFSVSDFPEKGGIFDLPFYKIELRRKNG
jgi:hypothetical protein